MKVKLTISIILVIGLASVSYGMIKDNDIVFLAGIILVTAGYILIRKKLKNSIKKMNDSEG
jgi:hypothetical protein